MRKRWRNPNIAIVDFVYDGSSLMPSGVSLQDASAEKDIVQWSVISEICSIETDIFTHRQACRLI